LSLSLRLGYHGLEEVLSSAPTRVATHTGGASTVTWPLAGLAPGAAHRPEILC